eukprot:scaffold90365_cov71-Phaeocystis_antarctica.AAC.2
MSCFLEPYPCSRSEKPLCSSERHSSYRGEKRPRSSSESAEPEPSLMTACTRLASSRGSPPGRSASLLLSRPDLRGPSACAV